MDELNIGLIGAGRMGAYHVETWERIACGNLVAIAEPEETVARERIGRRPIEWVGDYRWLLERADVDAVCICAPSAQHARIALDAIAAGKHVFVEKPIATALEDGLRMAAAARTGRPEADGGPRRALQSCCGQARRADRRGSHRPGLPCPRHPRRTTAGRASRTRAWRSTWPRTTSTSCSSCWVATSRASTPKAAAACIPRRRT